MDKIILITGGSSGIGNSMVEFLQDKVNTIYFTYNKNLEEAEKIESKYKNVFKFKLDLSDEEDIKNFWKNDKIKINPPNILVNNAGITNDGYFLTMSSKKWNNVINTNLNSTFLMSQKFSKINILKKRKASIINVSSISSISATIGQANYNSSKAAINILTRTLSKELAAEGIRVNGILPGFIQTPMLKSIPAVHQKEIIEKIPLKRIGRADEVAQLVYFLIDESKSGYITGANIIIDGGLTA